MNKEITLHTIATYNDKEYELQDLLNKLNIIEEYIKELDDETDDTCLYQITKETKEKLLSILRGDKQMNDEIKEILDFKENADYKKLSCDEIKVLRDYITNLQQENEKLKTKTIEQSLLLIDYQDMEQKLEDYKSRIDKAIEYIKQQYKDFEKHLGDSDKKWQPVLDNKKLLNILEGKDNAKNS